MLGIPLWFVLAIVTVLAWWLGDRRMLRGAVALLVNWCVLTAAATTTGDQYNVPLNMSVDWVTIWIGFAPATQLPQMLMALSFGISMLFHADHLLKLGIGIPVEQLKAPYWYRFHYLAWAQAALMIGWLCHGGGLSLSRTISQRRRLSSVATGPYLASVPLDEQ